MTEGLKIVAQAKEYAKATDSYLIKILVEGAAGSPTRYSVQAFHKKTYEDAVAKKITDTTKQGCFFNLEGLSWSQLSEVFTLLQDGWTELPSDESMDALQAREAASKSAESNKAKTPKQAVIATGGTTVSAK